MKSEDNYEIFNPICIHRSFVEEEDFSDRILNTLKKALESNKDTTNERIIDLSIQILRNLIKNDIISHEKAQVIGVLVILKFLVTNNKRINIVAQITSELSKNNTGVKNLILEEKIVLNSIIK